MITRETFLTRMNFRVAERQSIVDHIADFVAFDPNAKPVSDAYLSAHEKLVEQLKSRGVTGESAHPLPHRPMSKLAVQGWAYRFARMPDTETLVPYAKANDAALVPFLQAYETAFSSLRHYLQDRVEVPR